MKNEWYKLGPSDPVGGLTVVRIGVALIILMHPLHGFAHMEDIPRFGEYLSALGYPMGLQLAWMVLLIQTAASLALIINGWVIPGQGGMEWGFILLVCLFGVLWAYWPRSAKAPA